MPNCPQCNMPYEEGERFCNSCGGKLPVRVEQKICPVCGNTLFENTKVCNICGTSVSAPQDTTAAEELARQQEALKNPTMDEVEIPVITDDMLVNEEPNKADMPTMDSIFMPGQNAPSQPVKIAKPKREPEPIPQPSVVAPLGQQNNQYQQTNNNQFQQTNNNQYQQTNNYQQAAPQNQYQQTAQPQAVIPPQQNNGGFQQNMQQNNQFGQPNMAQPNMAQQNMAPNMQPNAMPMNNQPQQNAAKPAKGGSNIVPIILIIAIIAVILVDVFVVFRKQIFGDKDDKSKTKKNAAVITVVDDLEF